jgi:hypothetical protein
VIDDNTFTSQQHMDTAIAKASSLVGNRLHPITQDYVIWFDRRISHRHPTALQKLTRPPLAHLMVISEKCGSFPLGSGRHHFFPRRSFSATLSSMASPCPAAVCLQTARGASNRFSLAFSAFWPPTHPCRRIWLSTCKYCHR